MTSASGARLDDRVRRLLAAGDADGAAEAAIRGLGQAVQRYQRSALRDEALAADAFSEFAEDLWRGLPEFRGDASLKTWAFRLAWHAVLRVRDDAWQRRRRPLSAGPAAAVERLRTRTPVVRERRARALESLRARLSLEDQSLMVLRVDQALSWADIAQIVAEDGQPVAADALMKRFQRLKDRLAGMAREEGLV
jgi:RNA polymerase sigma-70 factor (ECF subfamily)